MKSPINPSQLEKIHQIKREQMDLLAEYRQEKLYKEPVLRHLYLELTLKCNEHCWHCGSRCAADQISGLAKEDYFRLLDEVKANFDISRMMLCITGGEPMLHPDFYEIMAYAHKLGFRWGMTSNATLITREAARKLKECGMGTISVSIDGLEETHDQLRGLKGAYHRAMEGVQNLIDEGGFKAIQITTVVNHRTIEQLDALYQVMENIDIDSWRVIGVEPIGRALDHPELLLTPEDQKRLFAFILDKRSQDIPVCYGCSHFLGLDLEHEVRDWYFLCTAGLYVASIMANGDVGACLDIERSPETVQGNIFEEPFTDIWKNKFQMFRKPLSRRCQGCKDCTYETYCAGGAHHSYDYEHEIQRICMKGILFE